MIKTSSSSSAVLKVAKKLKTKKGDTVQVITGSEKGKKGSVIEVNPKSLRIKVQGIKVQTHFDKKEGLLQKEGFFDYSNVKLVEAAHKTVKKTTKSKSS